MFGTRKLGRTSDQRKAMLRAMTTYLLENGKMETTFTRAKEVQPVVEKMITLGKKKGLANYRKALSYITKEDVAHKLFEEIAPKYAERNGGYTRVTQNRLSRYHSYRCHAVAAARMCSFGFPDRTANIFSKQYPSGVRCSGSSVRKYVSSPTENR